jgi:hypothetical protein
LNAYVLEFEDLRFKKKHVHGALEMHDVEVQSKQNYLSVTSDICLTQVQMRGEPDSLKERDPLEDETIILSRKTHEKESLSRT